MAIDFIAIDASKGTELLKYRSLLRAAYEQGLRVLEQMNHTIAPPNFASLEAEFGIPTGKGSRVYDMVNGSIGAMQNTFQNAECKVLAYSITGPG